MRILISGSHGLIGSALKESLKANGRDVVGLVRGEKPGRAGEDVVWNPATGAADAAAFEGFDAVVNLAGESIASGRWTEAKKKKIATSRVAPTQHLSHILGRLKNPPKAFISGSAIGYYGNRGDEKLTEAIQGSRDFLAQVCREWENATEAASHKGIRVVTLRTGIVLSTKGGALKQMLTPFKMGVGGKLGSGAQYMSWITLEDEVAAIEHAILDESIKGPVNLVSPQPVTNLEFTKTLGKILSRPTIFPMPAFVARAIFGEMADALLLSSARVVPEKLERAGFKFKNPGLESALNSILK